jgi:hypothetical protein
MNGVVELGYSRFLALNPKYTKKALARRISGSRNKCCRPGELALVHCRALNGRIGIGREN